MVWWFHILLGVREVVLNFCSLERECGLFEISFLSDGTCHRVSTWELTLSPANLGEFL